MLFSAGAMANNGRVGLRILCRQAVRPARALSAALALALPNPHWPRAPIRLGRARAQAGRPSQVDLWEHVI